MAYQTAAQIRTAWAANPAWSDVADTTKWPDATLNRYVASFEELVEDYRGVAYEPRTATETFLLDERSCSLRLAWPQVRSITSVTETSPAVGGSATTVSSTLYTFDADAGLVLYPTGFLTGSKVVVVYSHGFAAPPDSLVEATLEYVRCRAMQGRSGVARDVIAQNVEGLTTRFSTPDKAAGRPTGYLDVDRLLNSLADLRVPF